MIRAIVAIVCILPSLAFSQVVNNCGPGKACKAKSFTSTTASGSNGFACSNAGCRFYLGSSGKYLDTDGTYTRIYGALNVPDFNFTVSGSGVQHQLFVAQGANAINLRGQKADGSTAVGVILDNTATLSTDGAKLLSVRNNTTEKFNVRRDGAIQIGDYTAGTCSAGNDGLLSWESAGGMGPGVYACLAGASQWLNLATGETLSGYATTNSEETPITAKLATSGGKVNQGTFTVSTAGAGAGSAVLEVVYNGSQICTYSFSCAATGVQAFDTCASGTGNVELAGEDVVLQWDANSGCTTLPVGNVNVSWR